MSSVEIGAGQIKVTFPVDQEAGEYADYFMVEAVIGNRIVATCSTPFASMAHSCILEGLNSNVNYTITVRSCSTANNTMNQICSPPSDLLFASVRISGRPRSKFTSGVFFCFIRRKFKLYYGLYNEISFYASMLPIY